MQMIVDTIDLDPKHQERDKNDMVTGYTFNSPREVNSSELFKPDVAEAIRAVLKAEGRVLFCPVGTYGFNTPSYNAIVR